MSNELTAAEEDAITLTIDTEEPTLNVAPLLREVTRIVKAREAAARREAEDDPAHARMYRALVERAERAEAKVARVEALAEDMRMWCSPEGIATDYALRIEAALAEPGRDEEGGMLGGSPNFKHRDATVPVDGEQPGPSDEESGR